MPEKAKNRLKAPVVRGKATPASDQNACEMIGVLPVEPTNEPCESLEDMTNATYRAAYEAVFNGAPLSDPNVERLVKGFLAFTAQRSQKFIEDEARNLLKQGLAHVVFDALRRKLELLLEIDFKFKETIERIRSAYPEELGLGQEGLPVEELRELANRPGSPLAQVVAWDSLFPLVANRADKFASAVLNMEIPWFEKLGIDTGKLKRAMANCPKNVDENTRTEIESVIRRLGLEIELWGDSPRTFLEKETHRGSTITTSTSVHPSENEPSSKLPVIYYKNERKEHVKLTAGTVNSLHVIIQKGLFKFLKQYFHKGIPITPWPEALRVCEDIEYPEIDYAKADEVAKHKAETVVNNKFCRIRTAAKKELPIDENKNPLSLLRCVGIADKVEGAYVRVLKFCLLPLPENQSLKPECSSKNTAPTSA